MAQTVKCLSTMWETWVPSQGREDPLEKEMAIHSSTIAWKIPQKRSLVGYSPWGSKESDTTERLHFLSLSGCPGGASGKEPACQSRKLRGVSSISGLGKIYRRRARQPMPVFLPGKSQGQRRSLVGYSPWDPKS